MTFNNYITHFRSVYLGILVYTVYNVWEIPQFEPLDKYLLNIHKYYIIAR